MKRMIFALLFFTSCIISISCEKDIPVNNSVNLPPPPPPPPLITGSVAFWILNASDTYYGNAYITINNETKSANCYWLDTGPTNCSHDCIVSFNLPPGSYTWKAWNSAGDVKYGNLTVQGTNCMPQMIVF